VDESRRCRATSKQAQRRCKRAAIVGGAVCNMHGGKTPSVMQRARERLLELVDPAISELARLVRQADGDSVKLAAIRDVLDRAGFRPADLVAVDNQVTIRVSYEDVGPAPPPGRSTARQNGHHELTDGR
jgi:hypothetical protein